MSSSHLSFLTLAVSIITTAASAQERLIEINGLKNNVFTKGIENRKKGTPVLVFENGMGLDWHTWNPVIDQLAEVVPVVAYDRPGVGKSERSNAMPEVKYIAENLNAILRKLNLLPPYILIGHSMGGLYARAFAGYYPNDVAGLVFIDPADWTESKTEWNELFRRLGVPEQRIEEMLYERLYRKFETDSANYGPAREAFVLAQLRKTDFSAISDLPIPVVPVYFFIGGKFEVPLELRSKDFDHEEFFRIRTNANIERWKDFINLSPKGGSIIYLSHCGHNLHQDDPDNVIFHIKYLLNHL